MVRKLARAIGWRIRRLPKSPDKAPTWRVFTHLGPVDHASAEAAAKHVEDWVCGCWKKNRVTEELTDILEDPTHPKHAAVVAWYDRVDWGIDLTPLRLSERFNDPYPTEWDATTLSRLAPNWGSTDIFRSAIRQHRTLRSAARLEAAMANASPTPSPIHRPRL